MQTGAVIIASDPASDAAHFKPLWNVGSISVAKRVIATLRQAGVEKIVMVTGYHAAALERHLANLGIIFLRNQDFAIGRTMDSIGIGLQYLSGKCDQIILIPADVPFFSASTVRALADSGFDLACPVYQGRCGHPMLVRAGLIERLLAEQDASDLRSAAARMSIPIQEVPVDDPGILMDVASTEDIDAFLQDHNRQLTRPQISVALAREVTFFDEKIAMLLDLVDETSSVRTACQRMQISYSTGWNIIRILESQLACSLVVRSQGGTNGGQSVLTEYGKQLLEQYRGFREELQKNVDNLYKKYFGDVF